MSQIVFTSELGAECRVAIAFRGRNLSVKCVQSVSTHCLRQTNKTFTFPDQCGFKPLHSLHFYKTPQLPPLNSRVDEMAWYFESVLDWNPYDTTARHRKAGAMSFWWESGLRI